MITNDYIMRLVKQLGDALARVAGLRRQQQHVEAHEAIAEACDELLGHPPQLLDGLPPRTAAQLLGRWFKIKAYAALLEADDETCAAEGDAAEAARRYRRALEVFLEGIDRGGHGDRDLRPTVTRLLRHVRLDQLRPAYAQLVRDLVD